MRELAPVFRCEIVVDLAFDRLGRVGGNEADPVEQPFHVGVNRESWDAEGVAEQNIGAFSTDPWQ